MASKVMEQCHLLMVSTRMSLAGCPCIAILSNSVLPTDAFDAPAHGSWPARPQTGSACVSWSLPTLPTTMVTFVRDLGYDDPSFGGEPDRRAHLRAEFFHPYRLGRDEAHRIVDTFLSVHRRDPTPTAPSAPRA